MSDKAESVLRPTDGEALALARRLIRSARHGALAVLDANGAPHASRVATATDLDGAPVILVSTLAAHTAALEAGPRCSLLLGELGKGDPLAHPRVTLACRARRIGKEDAGFDRIRRRYLNRQPKARLYVDFPDFGFFRLEPQEASLNGGFGRAYRLQAGDLTTPEAIAGELAASEQDAIDHMNADHPDAIQLYARAQAPGRAGNWRIAGIDPDGLDLVDGDEVLRVDFPTRLASAADLRPVLIAMAATARCASA